MSIERKLIVGAVAAAGALPGVALANVAEAPADYSYDPLAAPPALDEMVHPVSGVVGSQPGDCRPIGSCTRRHEGYDISQNNAYPVGASCKGTATVRYDAGGYGNYVDVRHNAGYMTRYAHLSDVTVQSGQFVNQGDVIGHVGSTGASTGPHLHYEVRLNGTPLSLAGDYNRGAQITKGERMLKNFSDSLVCRA